jgi:hypothetical protein
LRLAVERLVSEAASIFSFIWVRRSVIVSPAARATSVIDWPRCSEARTASSGVGLGALVLGDGPDGGIVLGAGDRQAGGDVAQGVGQVAVDRVQRLQGDHRPDIGVDAVERHRRTGSRFGRKPRARFAPGVNLGWQA